MRVLHFGKFPARHFGGIETHVKLLTEGLATTGVDVTNVVYDLGRSNGGVEETSVGGVRILAVPCHGTLASLPLAPATRSVVARLSRDRRFDIVHAHFPDPLAFSCMPAALGAARVATWHSDIVRQHWFGKAYGVIARSLFAPLDAVAGATASHLASRQIDAFRPRHRQVVPFGIDLARFAPLPDDAAQVAALRQAMNGRPIIFALGRHVYYKGFDVLIDAMRDVDAVLMLGGEGPLTPALRAQAASLPHPERVRFVGRIADDDLPAHYQAADIYALPSLAPSEAFGLVQLEAMASHRAIVNCRLDNAVNEVAPDGVCAVTVTPGKSREFADALNRLLLDPELRMRLGDAGRQRVEQRFSTAAMVAATLSMYRTVLSP